MTHLTWKLHLIVIVNNAVMHNSWQEISILFPILFGKTSLCFIRLHLETYSVTSTWRFPENTSQKHIKTSKPMTSLWHLPKMLDKMMLTHSNWWLCWNDFIQIEWRQFLISSLIVSMPHVRPLVAFTLYMYMNCTILSCVYTCTRLVYHTCVSWYIVSVYIAQFIQCVVARNVNINVFIIVVIPQMTQRFVVF